MKKECRDCPQYKKRIDDLEEQLAYVKFELEDLRSKRYKSKKIRPPDDTLTPPLTPTSKKRGGLFGHIGFFRKKPVKIDRIEEVRIDKCPECGSSGLTECAKVHEHIMELTTGYGSSPIRRYVTAISIKAAGSPWWKSCWAISITAS